MQPQLPYLRQTGKQLAIGIREGRDVADREDVGRLGYA